MDSLTGVSPRYPRGTVVSPSQPTVTGDSTNYGNFSAVFWGDLAELLSEVISDQFQQYGITLLSQCLLSCSVWDMMNRPLHK